jgi:nucleoside-diphosphate-sugar epimerase
MAVMVTGGTGFVGLNIVEALLARGETVVVVAVDDVPAAAAAAFARLPGRLTAVRADVTDASGLAGLMRAHAVDRLFPFAAITSGPAREAEMPERIIAVNLAGFIGQLRAARDAGVRRVIAPSSAAAYGESFHHHAWLNETETPPVPVGVYGVTKYGVERSALRLGALWGVDVIAARISSVFGPWERDTGLRDTLSTHWHLAHLAAAGREAVLPAEIPAHSWVYSRDIAAGLLHLLDMKDPPHRVFNVCSGMAWGKVVTRWAEALAQVHPGFRWRQSADPGEVNVPLPDTRPRGTMDIARIAATGWRPRFGPEAAYADYAAWLTASGASDASRR